MLRLSVWRVAGPISAALRLGNTAWKKRRSSGEPLGTLCLISLARESNPRPPAPIAMCLTTELTIVVNRARAFRVGFGLFGSGSGFSGRVPAWILKNCRASIGPVAGAKSRFSVSDRVFAIDGVKQKEHLVASICLQKRWLILFHTNQSNVL